MPISQSERYFENRWYHLLEDPILFLLALKLNLLSGHSTIHLNYFDFLKSTSCVMQLLKI